MPFRLSLTALTATLMLAACQPAEAPKIAPAPAPAPTQPAAPLTQAAPTPPPPAPKAETAAPAGDTVVTRFKANGNSPAWMAEIDGDTITFEAPETLGADKKPRTAKVERLAYAKGATFDGKDGETAFSLDLNGKECGRTGGQREFSAIFTYGKSIYHGCADAVK